MKVSAALLASSLALATALGVALEQLHKKRVQQAGQTTAKACDCADGECCNSVGADPAERRYTLPHAHVTHWEKRSECDPKWSTHLAPLSTANATPSAAGDDHARTSFGMLILLRHGQSVWNRKPQNPEELWRYAGSIDIPLSDVGIQEAFEAGKRLEFTPVDVVFCSQMDRARSTVSLALSVHSSKKTPVVEHKSPLEFPGFEGVNDENPYEFIVPVYISPALNERNFGDLQGVPSSKHTVLFDKEQIRKIRNDYNTKFPGENGESCADVHARAIPFFNDFILPHLAAGRNVLLSSHGFVIRTLVKHLDNMDEREFNEQMKLEKSAPERCLLLAPTGANLIRLGYVLLGYDADLTIREWAVRESGAVASRSRRESQPKLRTILKGMSSTSQSESESMRDREFGVCVGVGFQRSVVNGIDCLADISQTCFNAMRRR